MEAGLSDHVWSIEELCSLLPKPESAAKRIGKELILRALKGRMRVDNETSSSMGYMCDWFAPVARIIWEQTGDGNFWHPRIRQCGIRARSSCFRMAIQQVASGCEERRSTVLAAIPCVLGYSRRDLPYTTFPITLEPHYSSRMAGLNLSYGNQTDPHYPTLVRFESSPQSAQN